MLDKYNDSDGVQIAKFFAFYSVLHHADLEWIAVGKVFSDFQDDWHTLPENLAWFEEGWEYSSTACKSLTGKKFEELCMAVDEDKVMLQDDYNAPFERRGLNAVANSIMVVNKFVSNLNYLNEIQDNTYQERMDELASNVPGEQTVSSWDNHHEILLSDICVGVAQVDKMRKKSAASKRAFDREKAQM